MEEWAGKVEWMGGHWAGRGGERQVDVGTSGRAIKDVILEKFPWVTHGKELRYHSHGYSWERITSFTPWRVTHGIELCDFIAGTEIWGGGGGGGGGGQGGLEPPHFQKQRG